MYRTVEEKEREKKEGWERTFIQHSDEHTLLHLNLSGAVLIVVTIIVVLYFLRKKVKARSLWRSEEKAKESNYKLYEDAKLWALEEETHELFYCLCKIHVNYISLISIHRSMMKWLVFCCCFFLFRCPWRAIFSHSTWKHIYLLRYLRILWTRPLLVNRRLNFSKVKSL